MLPCLVVEYMSLLLHKDVLIGRIVMIKPRQVSSRLMAQAMGRRSRLAQRLGKQRERDKHESRSLILGISQWV